MIFSFSSENDYEIVHWLALHTYHCPFSWLQSFLINHLSDKKEDAKIRQSSLFNMIEVLDLLTLVMPKFSTYSIQSNGLMLMFIDKGPIQSV